MKLKVLIFVFFILLLEVVGCSKLPVLLEDIPIERPDNFPPDVKIIKPSDKSSFNTTNIQIEVFSGDRGSGVDKVFFRVYLVNGQKGDFYQLSQNLTNIYVSSDGEYVLEIYAFDKKGNVSSTQSIVFIVDTILPSFYVSNFVDGIIINTTNFIVWGEVWDDRSGVKSVIFDITNLSQKFVSEYRELTNFWTNNIYIPQDGDYVALIYCYDYAGNVSSTQEVRFRLDATVPILDVFSPVNGQTFSSTNVSIRVGITEQYQNVDLFFSIRPQVLNVPEYQKIQVSGVSWNTNIGLSNGIFYFDVFVVDSATNYSITQSILFEVDTSIVDTTKPVISITYPTNDSVFKTNDLVVSGVCYDPLVSGRSSGVRDIFMSINSSSFIKLENFSISNWETNLIGLSQGMYNVSVYCIDNAGNVSITQNITFSVDTNRPSVNITYPGNGMVITNTSVLISGLSSDSESGVYKTFLKINDSPNLIEISGSSWSTNLFFEDGDNTVYAFVVDRAGNFSITQSISFTVKERPIVVVQTPTNWQSFDNVSVFVVGTSSDYGSGIKEVWISINNSTFSKLSGTSSWFTNVSGLFDGTNLLQVYSVDLKGNYSITQEVRFIVNEKPSIQILSHTNNQILSTNTFNIFGIANDFGSGVNLVKYSINSSPFSDAIGGSNWNFVVSNLVDGDYNIKVFAVDKSNNYSMTNDLNITLRIPPRVLLNYPTNYQNINLSNITIQGSVFDDEVGVKDVWFRLGREGNFGKISSLTFLNKTNVDWSTNINGLADGINYIYVYARDSNNTISLTQEIVFIVDTDFPSIVISYPSSNQVINSSSFTVYGNAFANISPISEVWYRINNVGSFQKANGTTNWSVAISNLSDNVYEFQVFCKNQAGNTSSTQKVTFYVSERPVVSVSFPSTGAIITNNLLNGINVQGESYDNSYVYQVYVSTNINGPYYLANGTNIWSYTFYDLPETTNYLYFYAVDVSNNYSFTNSNYFVVDTTFLGNGEYNTWGGRIKEVYAKSGNGYLTLDIVSVGLANNDGNHFFVLIDNTNLTGGHQPSSNSLCGDWLTGYGDLKFTNSAGINADLVIWGWVDNVAGLNSRSAKAIWNNGANTSSVISSITYYREYDVTYTFIIPYSVIGNGASQGHRLNVYVLYGKGNYGMASIFPSAISITNSSGLVSKITNKYRPYKLH